ncbi:MAG TPA: TolC family protein [Candidatus Acidoferrum sp.]|jgi:outer membrane protein TolC|nr:TolC family protein [Candidatus Acidoferrum sp.]
MTSLRAKAVVGLSLVLLLAGCTASHYRKSADKEVYSTIRSKTPGVPNMDTNFTIEQTNLVLLEGLPVITNVPEFLGADGQRERGARVLNLEEALNIAVRCSRAYQSRKESLYLSALNLTLDRHQFAPIFSASANANYGGETAKAETFVIDQVTGNLIPVFSDNLVERQLTTDSGSIGASWLIRDVGRLTAQLNSTFQRFISRGPDPADPFSTLNQSSLTASFTRPLLRNAAYKSEQETLIQAERQLLYDLRDFTRYRKDFSVQIATAYYGVLGNRDAAHNNFLNLQSSRKNAERSRALAQEGRITQSDLGRLEQQVLSAESAWINSVRSYQQALDNFKLQLGLNVGSNLVLDDGELESLQIRDARLSVDESIQVALAARLDYLNAKDQLADAVRKVELAVNFLKPQVDFSSSVTLSSNPNRTGGFQIPDPQRYSWNAGLFIDPGLDRMGERNSYRSALIARNRAARAIEQQEDDIKLQVRDSWRTLDQAKRNYEISEVGVKIAERRVEEQNLLAELGRAKAQDQVDAQNSLSDSKNQRTQALVTHTIARLQFWDNLGILYIKDNGRWEETQDAKAP